WRRSNFDKTLRKSLDRLGHDQEGFPARAISGNGEVTCPFQGPPTLSIVLTAFSPEPLTTPTPPALTLSVCPLLDAIVVTRSSVPSKSAFSKVATQTTQRDWVVKTGCVIPASRILLTV